jgi:serine O-acetyltransferase
LSVDKADASLKRHPTIEDHVVIYASATILGGKTIIGENSIVGGNVWLTRSIPPHTKVYYKAAMNLEMEKEFDTYVFKDL